MSADFAHKLHEKEVRFAARSARERIVLAVGPATALAGFAWALLQPWRLTLLHPAGEGFWWLLAEPPLYVVLVGVLFRAVIAPGLVRDLEEGV
jgi:hypothetical protein